MLQLCLIILELSKGKKAILTIFLILNLIFNSKQFRVDGKIKIPKDAGVVLE